jgi:hypothetical protein
LIQLFAIVAIVPIAGTTAAWLYTSQGQTRRLFWTSLVYTGLLALAFVIGLRGGLVGLALAYAIVSAVFGIPFALLAAHAVGLRAREVGRGVLAPVLAWLQALALLAILQAAWPGGGWALLAVGGVLAAPAYLLVLWLVDPELVRALRRLRHDLRKRPTAPAPADPSAANAAPAPSAVPAMPGAPAEAAAGGPVLAAPPLPRAVRFRLGKAPDVGWLAGLPGITPLHLQGEVFTARVADPEDALRVLRAAGFPEAAILEPDSRGDP